MLCSGNANNTDASAVTPVSVPTADPTLRFLAKYGAEFGYDYGYVQVSTDGGATYTTIPGDKTVDAPLGPGLNGTTTGFEPHSYDLSAYAGQSVLVAFRYVSDGGVNEGGLLVDDITVGGTSVSDGSSLAPFKSPTQIHPIEVHNWNVRLVGINEGKVPVVLQAEFNGRSSLRLTRGQLALAQPVPEGRRHRGVRRADRAGPAVRAVHPHGERRRSSRAERPQPDRGSGPVGICPPGPARGRYSARRPTSALPSVTSSAYSRSAPTGRPEARRVTATSGCARAAPRRCAARWPRRSSSGSWPARPR